MVFPQYGLVSERNNEGWTAPNGKSPVNYANVMDKLKNGDDVVTQEMAVAEAAKFGWTIPEEQFVKTKTRKGRPAKAKAEKTEKKTRGRPKKQKPVTTGGAGDDLIAQLVAQANIQNAQLDAPVEEEKASQPSSPSTEEDESTDQSEPTTPIQPTQAVKPDAPKKAKKPRKPKMTEEEKEAAKLAKQQEREAAKLAKQQEREAAKAKAKAEKEAAKAAAKAEKEAAKAKAKAEKEAAKAAKKAPKKVETPVESPNTETDEKEASPEQLAQNLDQLELEPESPTNLDQDDESEEEEEEVKVETKTGSDGKTYMVDADGNVYDEEGYEIGTWDEEAKAVVA